MEKKYKHVNSFIDNSAVKKKVKRISLSYYAQYIRKKMLDLILY